MIYALSFKHPIPENSIVLDVTSRSSNWGRNFSPFVVGPVSLYGDYWSYNIENAFQYSRVHEEHLDSNGLPSPAYWEWAKKGWLNPRPNKYPMGAWNRHVYHWWDGRKLSMLEAQKEIFLNLYKNAITKTSAFQRLKELYESSEKDIILLDFEGYNHRFLELTWDQVINDENRPVGQAFALCMILEGYL